MPQPRPHPGPPAVRRAFTLIELLVTMGIIVLLIALALPAFSFITGSRSGDAGGNQIAAALGVARTQAIGLQKYCGVMFFIEPSSDRVQMTLVQEANRPDAVGDPINRNVDEAVNVYLDLAPDVEFVKLPVGVGVQTITNGMFLSNKYTPNDRYIGFNSYGITSDKKKHNESTGKRKIDIKIGGVILFDGNGMLAAKTYAFRARLGETKDLPQRPISTTAVGSLLYFGNLGSIEQDVSQLRAGVDGYDYLPVSLKSFNDDPRNLPLSQLGVVFYDANAFSAKGFLTEDQRVGTLANDGTAAPPSDADKEAWLDENATPAMINRYNGTLVRGE